MKCALCGKPINTTAGRWYQRVVGWDQPRKGGGSNKITLKEHTGVYACAPCVDTKRTGVLPGQGELL